MNDTKERILSIALCCFLRKPYTEVTMNEILKASGLSKGGFYHHFVSKETLYHEVVDQFILRAFLTEYGHFVNNPYDISFIDFIPMYVKSSLEHLIEFADAKQSEYKLNINEVNIYIVMFDMMKHYKGFDQVIGELHQKETDLFRILIDKAKENGEIRKDIDSISLARHVHTLMHGIGVLTLLEGEMADIESIIKEHFNNLYQLIRV
jgi:AcrR family transcriptional regulator